MEHRLGYHSHFLPGTNDSRGVLSIRYKARIQSLFCELARGADHFTSAFVLAW